MLTLEAMKCPLLPRSGHHGFRSLGAETARREFLISEIRARRR
jgi:hypothetical protein